MSGELAVYVADYEDGHSETSYFLRDVSGTERRLNFAQTPDVDPGSKIHVWGSLKNDAIDVTAIKPVLSGRDLGPGIGSQSSELIGGAPRTPRVLCTVLVGNGAAPSITQAAVDAAWHTGPKSDNAYIQENSYGRDAFTGQTYGPFMYPMGGGCDTNGLASTLRPMIPAADGCQHYAWVMSPNANGCGWAGLGSVGTSDKPQKDTWYNNTTGCVAAVQEVMHNWGSLHSSSITCSGATAAQGGINDTLAGCTHSEYGDKFDTLGGGCRHMNAWQKLYQKVWGGCNAVKVRTTGTFNLYPTEIPCNGVQALEIPFPGGKTRSWQGSTLTSWYLEYRTSQGAFDTGMTPQVLVHLGIAPVLANQANPRGSRVWIANASGNAANPGLVAGKSFTDPAGGLTVTVMSMDANMAVVQVDVQSGMGDNICLDGTGQVFQAPGPSDCTQAPPPPMTGTGGAGGAATTTGAGGRGGAGGTGGKGGAGGGVGGKGGAGGATGVGGTGGTTGAGTGGQAGSGGPATTTTGPTTSTTTGMGGDNGTGVGTGGQGGAGPTSTTTTTGVGGNSSTTGSAGKGGTRPGGDLNGGCACRIENTQRGNSMGALFAVGLGAFFASRRRNRRRVD